MRLELEDIQGNVLQGYGLDEAAYVFVQIDDADAGRRLVREFTREVTAAQPWRSHNKPSLTVNLALTASGLAALEVDPEVLERLPGEFRQGMAARAPHWLGDTGKSHPCAWEPGYGDGSADLLVTVNAAAKPLLDERLADLLWAVDHRAGLRLAACQRASQLPRELGYGREHFGYLDGFAQPAVEGQPLAPRPGEGVATRGGGWRALAAGEFILGLPDEHGGAPLPPLCRNGTFMVYRKLRQDVARFREYVRRIAVNQFGGDEDLVAAKIIGRWRDGTPLELAPHGADARLARDRQRTNAFSYAGDPGGRRCPIGAHIRRANPRDALPGGPERTVRHRIIRRGMPYGEPLPPGAEDDGQDRGLVFVCFNASIVRQFEAVMSWLVDGDAFRLGAVRDLMSGDARRSGMTIQGDPPVFLAPEDPFVTTRGGEYLLLPGISALRALGGER